MISDILSDAVVEINSYLADENYNSDTKQYADEHTMQLIYNALEKMEIAIMALDK